MDLPVVVLLDPPGEEPFELGHRGDTIGEELDFELVTDRAEEPFDLPSPGRFTGFGVPQSDPHLGECPPELRGHKRRPVVEITARRDTPTAQPLAERVPCPKGVLGQRPFPARDQPGVVIDKREQDRLVSPGDKEPAMHRVTGPDLVDR